MTGLPAGERSLEDRANRPAAIQAEQCPRRGRRRLEGPITPAVLERVASQGRSYADIRAGLNNVRPRVK